MGLWFKGCKLFTLLHYSLATILISTQVTYCFLIISFCGNLRYPLFPKKNTEKSYNFILNDFDSDYKT